jgi:AmmeMemoRadiSam system protein A
VALSAAKALGAAHARVVSYANSGDCAVGTRERVVGYGAVVLCDGPGEPDSGALEPLAAPPSRTLSPDERRALLALARETISRFLETGMTPQGRGFAGGIECERGAFVTLKKDGRLRGCIGHMAEDAPLSWAVRAMALQAAFNDRRFPPLERDELDHLEIEISALTPARRVGGPADIVLGRDGVILRKEGRSAVFLPQVAVEQGWDRETMLSELSRKAGLPAGAWKSGAEFLTFEAEVFAEAAPR